MEEAEIPESTRRVTRPSFAQVKAILEFMEKHPDLAHRKQKDGMSNERFKTLWMELSSIVNDIQGTTKSVKGWIKFWSDKRRSIILKQKQIAEGKITDPLTVLELRILDLTPNIKHAKRKSSVKQEACNGDDALDSIFEKDDDVGFPSSDDRLLSTDTDERYTNVMEKLVDVMDQQALALSQMAEATLKSSKALEQMAEASHKQLTD
ncbi:PREDICTED: uncharacterized protein LOC106100415 isoform X2 [Papilio polytes]|uniref:uncharacterized protein LOC106100415 isoform X2 n=1 Tax=Papilio polytes TaxID=76194 RepID=UPI0006767E60|nr:PREDICTED: uncharacterized protein LOC106100415 isoform X2 [Papilio polytes]